MKKLDIRSIELTMNDLLEDIDTNGGNPGYCYEDLAKDMAKAAAQVYDACMKGQAFADKEKRS